MIRLTAVIELEGHAPRALTHESNARSIVLGRDASADFQLPLSTISRRHVRISEVDGVYVVEDLGSTHGSCLNGARLVSGEKKLLRNGDLLELTKAKVTCSIESDKVVSADPSEGTQAIAARAVQGILGRLGEAQGEGPFFRALNGPDEGARYSLAGPGTEWSFGRSRDCDFVVNDPNVSRRHALVRKDWNGFVIGDLGSKNGVIINNRQVSGTARLRDHDEVDIGPLKLVFIDPDAELLAALKDVPGFELEDGSDGRGSRFPAGRDAGVAQVDGPADDDLGPPLGAEVDGVAEHLDGQSQGQADVAAPSSGDDADLADDDLADIDPELLQGVGGKLPVEWLIIAGAGVVIAASVVLLFAMLV